MYLWQIKKKLWALMLEDLQTQSSFPILFEAENMPVS